MNRMLEDARLSAMAMNAEITKVVFVPGTSTPLILENMLMDDSLDAACVLGYIEKGSTLHGEEMGNTCSLIFKQLELEYRKRLVWVLSGGDRRVGEKRESLVTLGMRFVPRLGWLER